MEAAPGRIIEWMDITPTKPGLGLPAQLWHGGGEGRARGGRVGGVEWKQWGGGVGEPGRRGRCALFRWPSFGRVEVRKWGMGGGGVVEVRGQPQNWVQLR